MNLDLARIQTKSNLAQQATSTPGEPHAGHCSHMSEVKIFQDVEHDEAKSDYSFPEATQILPYDAPEEDWIAQRSKGIGGSDASVIMGENRYRELLDLYEDKKG